MGYGIVSDDAIPIEAVPIINFLYISKPGMVYVHVINYSLSPMQVCYYILFLRVTYVMILIHTAVNGVIFDMLLTLTTTPVIIPDVFLSNIITVIITALHRVGVGIGTMP